MKKRKVLTEAEWVKDALENFIEYAEAFEKWDDVGVYNRTLARIHDLEASLARHIIEANK